jgi:hypothetical protein
MKRRDENCTVAATEQFISLFFYCNFVKNHWRSVINEPKIAINKGPTPNINLHSKLIIY